MGSVDALVERADAGVAILRFSRKLQGRVSVTGTKTVVLGGGAATLLSLPFECLVLDHLLPASLSL